MLVIFFLLEKQTKERNKSRREEQVKKGFSSHFNVKDLGKLSYFLGVTVNHNHAEGSIWIGQPTYMSNVLEKLGMKDFKPACCYICQCWFRASKSYRTRWACWRRIVPLKCLYFVGCKFRGFHDFHFNRKIYLIENQRIAKPCIDSPKIAKITFANHVLQANSWNIQPAKYKRFTVPVSSGKPTVTTVRPDHNITYAVSNEARFCVQPTWRALDRRQEDYEISERYTESWPVVQKDQL